MSIALIAGIVIVVLIVVIALTQRSGPRVTHIERVVEEEDVKDRRDA